MFLHKSILSTALLGALLLWTGTAHSQGIVLTGAGPVNQGIGGASTAAPLDSAGALYWNPATISAVTPELQFGFGTILPNIDLSSRVNAGAFGGAPGATMAGSSSSESGISSIPSISYVRRNPDSDWSLGMGIFTIGGFNANFPASRTNPILTPQAPYGFGGGRTYSYAQIYQVAPTLAYAVTDRFSIGFAPTLTMGLLLADPLFLSAPNDADGDGFARFGTGIGTRISFGGGFHLGAYYITESKWHFGAAIKSPQWLEPIRFNSQDELGFPIRAKVHFDYPLIASLGGAYSGIDQFTFAADVRFIDYNNAQGFGTTGIYPDGSAAGLGWRSIIAVATGMQYQMNDKISFRLGYVYNQNPIPDSMTFVNVASALIQQHEVDVGLSFQITERLTSTLAYSHGFSNSITGPYLSPSGPIAGTSVTTRVSSEYFTTGMIVKF